MLSIVCVFFSFVLQEFREDMSSILADVFCILGRFVLVFFNVCRCLDVHEIHF